MKSNTLIKTSMITAAMLLPLSVQAASEIPSAACYRSHECATTELCIDRVCVDAADELSECTPAGTCSWNEVCDDGLCKPMGVICEDEFGSRCTEEANSMECYCAAGDGVGENKDGEVEPISDEALYAQCLEDLSLSCDATPLDISEFCSPEEAAYCTDLITKWETLENNCEDAWDDDPTVDTEGAQDTAGIEDWDTAISVSDTEAEISAASPSVAIDPWMMADCCEEIQEADDDPEWKAYLDCLAALDDDDCGGALACEENLEGCEDDTDIDSKDTGGDEADSESNEADTGGSDADGDADADVENGDDGNEVELDTDTEDNTADDDGDDQDTEEQDGNDAVDDESNSSNSGGCSVGFTSTTAPLVTLIKTLF